MYPRWRPRSPRRSGDSAPGQPGGSTRWRLSAGLEPAGCRVPPGLVIALNLALRAFHGADMELTPKRYVDTVVLAPRGRIDHSTSEEFKTALAPHITRC